MANGDQANQASSQGKKDDKNTAPGEVNTGGGVYAAGDIATGGGDFIGRDKTVHGDEVARDKVVGSVFHVSGGQVIIQAEHESVLTPEHPDAEPAPGESPYKGLQFFDVSDVDLFFGREQLTAELVARLRQQRFLAVVGASGSGKSSVVRAGLVPALTKGEPLADGTRPPEGYQAKHVHIITPTKLPLESLASSLTRASESVIAATTLADDLAKDPRSLRVYVRRLLEGGASTDRLLLVVDQFEELFTLCRDKAQQKALVDNLLTAASEESQAVVVITLRADFYAQCAEFANLRAALANYQAYIGPMTSAELRSAIEKPAHLGHWALEPGLVDQMLRDVGAEPGALPLLSHALLETWKRRRGRTLTLAGYAAAGRVQGAIAQTAETVLRERLTPVQQGIAHTIFVRLTELGEGTQDTRRRVAFAELMPNEADRPAVEQVLKTLVDARLVTTFQEEAEVAHEALIREWPTLREWLQSDREGLRVYRHLTEAAQEWAKLARDPGALYRGARLAQTLEWVSGHRDGLNPLEREFLAASQALVDAERRQEEKIAQEREAARQRELTLERQRAEEQRKAAATLRKWAMVLVIVSICAVIFALAAGYFGNEANKQKTVAIANAKEADKQKGLAVVAQQTAEANADLAEKQLARLEGERLFQEAETLKEEGKVEEAMVAYTKAAAADDSLKIDLAEQEKDVRRQAAVRLVHAGETLARNGDLTSAAQKYQMALDIQPPLDTPVYVRVPAGEFTMGSDTTDTLAGDDEKPQHKETVSEFWIQRTEVTNAQYGECVKAKACTPPNNTSWDRLQSNTLPVTDVSWHQVISYTNWMGGRLPNEAEWEKACRGTAALIYPWGNSPPTGTLANSGENGDTLTNVGSYLDGKSPYGLLDMAGNVLEWTRRSLNENYRYSEDPNAEWIRALRGGSFFEGGVRGVRCAARYYVGPSNGAGYVGFRVVSPGF